MFSSSSLALLLDWRSLRRRGGCRELGFFAGALSFVARRRAVVVKDLRHTNDVAVKDLRNMAEVVLVVVARRLESIQVVDGKTRRDATILAILTLVLSPSYDREARPRKPFCLPPKSSLTTPATTECILTSSEIYSYLCMRSDVESHERIRGNMTSSSQQEMSSELNAVHEESYFT